MRKLASIQRIQSLTNLDNSDNLSVARILGWDVVVQRNKFKVGDLVVYCEIDSILPDRPEFEFLRKNKFRIKTVKIRGQISQGICFSLPDVGLSGNGFYESFDVTETLGITKYESKYESSNNNLGRYNWPEFLRKTDETRIQNINLDKYVGLDCYATEKLDGSSITIYKHKGKVGVCSRNRELDLDESNVFVDTVKSMGIIDKISSNRFDNYALQGELIGPKVQGNKYKLSEHTIRFFSLYSIVLLDYLNFDSLKYLCRQIELDTVPRVDVLDKIVNDQEYYLRLAEGASKLNPSQMKEKEGIVVRLTQDSNISFKVINPKFLLKYE